MQALSLIRHDLQQPSRDVSRNQANAEQRTAEEVQSVRNGLSAKSPKLVERFDKIYDWTQFWTQTLNDRHAVSRVYNWLLELAWHVGTRLSSEGALQQPDDVFKVFVSDLKAFDSGHSASWKRTARERIRQYALDRRLTPPKWLGDGPSSDYWETVAASAGADANGTSQGSYEGVGNHRGTTTGSARILNDVDDPDTIDELTGEDIIVLTTPQASRFADWHSLLMVVKGVVSTGAVYHHLEHVAMECDVPLIHSVQSARNIPSGALIEMDSAKGSIHLV